MDSTDPTSSSSSSSSVIPTTMDTVVAPAESPPSAITPSGYRDLILNTRVPIILHNVPLNWSCLDAQRLPLEEWAALFDAATATLPPPVFSLGRQIGGLQPQFERTHRRCAMRMAHFVRTFDDNADAPEVSKATTIAGDDGVEMCWASYSYKTVAELPAECREGISFEALGLRRAAEQCTFWLGSRGAHTPCHYDTYGCNVVVQVYGQKSWLLMPPSSTNATRVPYEESSVYSTENFFSPQPLATDDVPTPTITARRCVLQPGDVLIVPHKWWHYAENVTTSLSINTWLEIKSDMKARLEECIVRNNVTEFTRSLDVRLLAHLINPNELEAGMYDERMPERLRLLNRLVDHLKNGDAGWLEVVHPHHWLSPDQAEKLIDVQNRDLVRRVPTMSVEAFQAYFAENARRFRRELADDVDDDDEEIRNCTNYINATCLPRQVEKVMRFLMNN